MKNMNSFRSIVRAIEYEADRQIELIENGGKVEQETLRWDDVSGKTYSMRDKEDAQDYRYFPDPDLLAIRLSDEYRWFDFIIASQIYFSLFSHHFISSLLYPIILPAL